MTPKFDDTLIKMNRNEQCDRQMLTNSDIEGNKEGQTEYNQS